MRKPVVAGNWKMNKTVEQARSLVAEMLPGLQLVKDVEIVLCPPYISLLTVKAMLQGTNINLGAQDLHWESSGAFTGEVSAEMIHEFCQYVIIGHSERRTYFHETDETVNKKVKSSLISGLTPIVCVGETLEENDAGKTAEVVTRQIEHGLKELTPENGRSLVIAYEPVWAIGTGRAATGGIANDVCANMIRPALANQFGSEIADSIRILYGGSVTGANAVVFFSQSDIDGALVGGASLKPQDFSAIAFAAQK
jgi:triosephosphate isomerase